MIRRGTPRENDVVHQFRRTSMITAIIVIALLTIGASAIGWHFLHRQTIEHLRSVAALTAVQAQAAVLFGDARDAEELLQAIPASGGVAYSELRDESGSVLAQHAQFSPRFLVRMARWLHAEVATSDIVVDDRKIGTVILVGSNEPLVNALFGLIVSDIVVAVLIAFLSLLIVSRYTRRITDPLGQLREIMRTMIGRGDFSQRAPAFVLTEVEELRTEFNTLLNEIERRDHDLKQANDALARLAFRDALTGLPNRAMFERALAETIKASSANGSRVGMLYCDVDGFKAVNDRFGHAIGDQLLSALGERIQAWLPDNAMAARIGGDEFVVLISPLAPANSLRELAMHLRATVESALPFASQMIRPAISIGSAVFPDDSGDADELVRAADHSMYAEKKRRRTESAT